MAEGGGGCPEGGGGWRRVPWKVAEGAWKVVEGGGGCPEGGGRCRVVAEGGGGRWRRVAEGGGGRWWRVTEGGGTLLLSILPPTPLGQTLLSLDACCAALMTVRCVRPCQVVRPRVAAKHARSSRATREPGMGEFPCLAISFVSRRQGSGARLMISCAELLQRDAQQRNLVHGKCLQKASFW